MASTRHKTIPHGSNVSAAITGARRENVLWSGNFNIIHITLLLAIIIYIMHVFMGPTSLYGILLQHYLCYWFRQSWYWTVKHRNEGKWKTIKQELSLNATLFSPFETTTNYQVTIISMCHWYIQWRNASLRKRFYRAKSFHFEI